MPPLTPPVPVTEMLPVPESNELFLIQTAREKPVATPEAFASRVIGAPFERKFGPVPGVTVEQPMQMFLAATRSIALPAPPLTVTEPSMVRVPPMLTPSRRSGVTPPVARLNVAVPGVTTERS